MTRLNMKTVKKVCPFLPADREEENTEDDQIENEDNEESVSFSPADREHRRLPD